MSRKKVVILLIALLIVDQIVKILVKTNMTINQSIPVLGDWFLIRFIENPGAAFGMELGGGSGKLLLSLFRIVAIGLLSWYMTVLFRKQAPKGILIGFTLILAGAVGNMIDSAFYGLLFSESTMTTVATFLPEGGGYAGLLHGHVVDMLYFPLWEGFYPSWFPWVGGAPYQFFAPVFNLADSYIFIGVVYMLFFQRKFFA